MNNDNDEIIVSSERYQGASSKFREASSRYQEASIRFREEWLEYVNREDRVKFEIINMVTILEQEGYNRTQAVKKIINDHKDLKGFSRATIYRELPEDMKDDTYAHHTKDRKQNAITAIESISNEIDYRDNSSDTDWKAKYEESITPYEDKGSVTILGGKVTITAKADPSRQRITNFEIDDDELNRILKKRFG